MKIFVHDYAGHPFQVHLSRHLAMRGHKVVHAFFADDPGPKGVLSRGEDDPLSLSFLNIAIDRPYDKGQLIARHFNDIEYGRRAGQAIQDYRPDVVISGNTPTASQTAIVAACNKIGSGFVYWLQDFYSIAVTKLLYKRLGSMANAISWYYRWLERRQLRNSDAVVIISEDFRPLAAAWAHGDRKVHTITNWAAVDDIPVLQKDNAWSREHGQNSKFTFLYSGTLGLKHNPDLLIKLAQECGPDASVAVVAQGAGVKQLEAAKAQHGLDTLQLLPLQPAHRLPEVLASGDVLLAVIEKDAAIFSVPSKVQSYMCAGRPILLAAPAANLAARVVRDQNAGIVVEPDCTAFVDAALRLRDDAGLRAEQAVNGRAYAERTFDMAEITDAFERILRSAARKPIVHSAVAKARRHHPAPVADNLQQASGEIRVGS